MDTSLLNQLLGILNVNIEQTLLGDLEPNTTDGGNMKGVKFYVCPNCNTMMAFTGEGEIPCYGRKLLVLSAKPKDGQHFLKVETVEDESYITSSHEMIKEHYLNFICHVTYDRMLFVKLYPEQGGEVHIPRIRGGKLYFGCSRHGLWANDRTHSGARNQRDNQL